MLIAIIQYGGSSHRVYSFHYTNTSFVPFLPVLPLYPALSGNFDRLYKPT